MNNIELLRRLETIADELVDLHEYAKYAQLCDEAKKSKYPSVADALDAILYAIKWAKSQSN